MEQFHIHFACQAHETHSLILDLGYQCFVVVVLRCYQLCNEVFSVGLSHGLTLAVEHVGQVIMILLSGGSNFNEWQHEDPWGEEDSGVEMDASHILQDFSLLAVDFFEIFLEWVEAVVDIIFICVPSYKFNFKRFEFWQYSLEIGSQLFQQSKCIQFVEFS